MAQPKRWIIKLPDYIGKIIYYLNQQHGKRSCHLTAISGAANLCGLRTKRFVLARNSDQRQAQFKAADHAFTR